MLLLFCSLTCVVTLLSETVDGTAVDTEMIAPSPSSSSPSAHGVLRDRIHREWIRWSRSSSGGGGRNNASSAAADQTTTTRMPAHDDDDGGGMLLLRRDLLNLDLARLIHSVTVGVTRSIQLRGGHNANPPVGVVPPPIRNNNGDADPPGPAATTDPSRHFLPATTYGADPTGRTDSTAAFDALMGDVLSCRQFQCHKMASNIVDLGGATIDLEGGVYLISKPIYVPPLFGNLNIMNGELRAASAASCDDGGACVAFPSDRWMIEVGNLTECTLLGPERDVCHEFVNLQDLLLHTGGRGGGRCAGGIKADRIMGMTIDAVFVTGAFRQAGIQVNEGHEVEISNSWVGDHAAWASSDRENEREGGEAVETPRMALSHPSSPIVGIQINGHDHYITNTILFGGPPPSVSSSSSSSAPRRYVGVEINGTAAVLQGVHAWLSAGSNTNNTSATVSGIQLGNSLRGTFGNRMMGCHLERGNSLDLYSPVRTIVEGTFFYREADAVRIVAGTKGPTVDGLIMRSNTYHSDSDDQDDDSGGGNATAVVHPIRVVGTFRTVRNVQIRDNDAFDGIRSTRATKSLTQQNATSWVIDFRNELLFPLMPIERIHSSVMVSGTTTSSDDVALFLSHMTRPAVGTKVEVVTSMAVDATVFVTVEQAV